MPLEILLILVVGGISVTALLLHLSGRSNRRVMQTEEDVTAEWLRQFPDDFVQGVIVSLDGHSALVQTETGLGLLWSHGADTVGRHLLDYDLVDRPEGFQIYFHDFAAPQALLHLSPEECKTWKNLMERS
ncbi:hypothetical protein DS909_20590 [Phaeobacter gallaeciensis]|uniref:Uncharacterized protein n=2 Tax=Roseobacteraceae TaxID=2854170 RepID=A0A366WQ29_9RHOB|nr:MULTISPECIES: hypothetical protein [Roseobacteraceae]MBT3141479.1 hypothetical protein [Falsiruegeria litorea]MBT8167379.1 hypothetical protein [Falsiruegeria litorea]RBW50951.1 hypothetical protein DS909_20590 [Phaeobacter gallaeciensis]